MFLGNKKKQLKCVFLWSIHILQSHDSSLDVVSCYELGYWGLIPGRAGFFLWPLVLLSSGYWGFFLGGCLAGK
jgi:hypothetical protein